MDEHQMVWNEKVAKDIIKNLEKRRMEGSYSPTAAQAKDEIVEMISRGGYGLSLWIYDGGRHGPLGGDNEATWS